MHPEPRNNPRVVWIVLVVGLVALLCAPFVRQWYSEEAITIPTYSKNVSDLDFSSTAYIGNTQLTLAVADTEPERIKGLSGQTLLPPLHGLLFVFTTSDRWGIWMKDMNFAIDILWLDEKRKIIHIEPNVPPETYPRSFTPKRPARYVLELPAGTVAETNISVGAVLEVSHNGSQTTF